MATIFSAPSTIEKPTYNFGKVSEWKNEEKYFCEQLKEILQKRCKQELVGEIIKFPVADGYASYMVASIKPLHLVHLPLGDEWNFQYANRLTTKDVKEKIEFQKKLELLFKK